MTHTASASHVIGAPKQPRRSGRPSGSIDPVLQDREFGLDQFAAVKSFLYGVDPLVATKRYLLGDDTPLNTEAALRKLGQIMLRIAARGITRRHGPDDAMNALNQRAAQAIETAGNACLETVKTLTTVRATARAADQVRKAEKARERNLAFLPSKKMPTPPAHFNTLRAFDDWYEDTFRPDDLLDKLELQAKFQEHLSAWYESQGIYYEPDYSKSHHQFSEQTPMAATQITQVERPVHIEDKVRSAAARHIDALQWTVQRTPDAADHVSAWIGGSTLDALKRSDIFTLYTLGEIIKANGASWWRQVKGLGPARANRLKQWLIEVKVQGIGLTNEHFESIQYRRTVEVKNTLLNSPALPALKALHLEPLGHYVDDVELNGVNGIFRRREPNHFKAENDIDAIVSALRKYLEKKSTVQVYAREICRFCLWSYRIKKLPISSLGIDEAREFREFLDNIPADWISQTSDAPPRGASDWRPFRGQLDDATRRKALTAINVVLRQLMEGGYLTGNPMAGVLKHAELAKPKMDVMHSFTQEQWALICELLEKQPPSPSSRRLQAMFAILQSTGLRRDELFKSRLGHIEKMRVDGEIALLLTVTGKRSKERQVLIPTAVMHLLELHIQDRREVFSDDLATKEGRCKIPLISVLGQTIKAYRHNIDGLESSALPDPDITLTQRELASPVGALGPDGLKSIMSRFLRQCEQEAAARGIDHAAFGEATLHWLRHTFGHTMADSNVDLRVIQKAMGHVNINTTAHYSKADIKQMVRGLRQGRAIAEPPSTLPSPDDAMDRLN